RGTNRLSKIESILVDLDVPKSFMRSKTRLEKLYHQSSANGRGKNGPQLAHSLSSKYDDGIRYLRMPNISINTMTYFHVSECFRAGGDAVGDGWGAVRRLIHEVRS
ncbi:MAG: hypothetical protein ABW095_06825, partial [Candidatus Thiodiazotropha sp.]